MPTATDLFWLSVEERVCPLQLRDGVLYSDHFGLRIDFEADSIVKKSSNRTTNPEFIFYIFKWFFIAKNSFFRGSISSLVPRNLPKDFIENTENGCARRTNAC
ncbi:hypothetical protein ACRPOS_007470 [Bartonella heixiaziensis]